MEEYSYAGNADIHFICGEGLSNSLRARILYVERFPARTLPRPKPFKPTQTDLFCMFPRD